MYKDVLVVSVSQRIAKSGRPYLSVQLSDKSYAQCWDKGLWGAVNKACDSQKTTRFEFLSEEARDGSGETYTRVVGVEHPDQMMLPGLPC